MPTMAEELDREKRFPYELVAELAELGLMGMTIPEAYEHPHNRARGTFIEVGGIKQPRPAPRFSRSACEVVRPPPAAGEHTDQALGEWGFTGEEIRKLREAKAVA